MKGTPNGARERGFSSDSVDCAYKISTRQLSQFRMCGRIISALTLSGFPATATSVPRRVYSLCEAERETESSEYGEPMTSNRASFKHKLSVQVSPYAKTASRRSGAIPAESRRFSTAPNASPPPVLGDSVLGVALIWMPRHWQHTYCTEFWLRNARAVRSSGEGPLIVPIVELVRASRKLDVELLRSPSRR
jgi:hypothetical protein